MRNELRALTPRIWITLFILGALFVAEAGTFYAALERIPVSLATVISYSTIGFVALLSVPYARPLSMKGWLGVGAAIAGAFVAIGEPFAQFELLGIVLAFGSATFHAGWAILTARAGGERSHGMLPGTSPVVTIAIMSVGTAASLGIVVAVGGGDLAPGSVSVVLWPYLLPLGAFSVIGISAWYAATRRIGVARSTIVSASQLGATVLLSATVLGESITPNRIAGALLIAAAILFIRDREPSEGAVGSS
jgi:drug/metabolite transporter (DMT)-like permease